MAAAVHGGPTGSLRLAAAASETTVMCISSTSASPPPPPPLHIAAFGTATAATPSPTTRPCSAHPQMLSRMPTLDTDKEDGVTARERGGRD